MGRHELSSSTRGSCPARLFVSRRNLAQKRHLSFVSMLCAALVRLLSVAPGIKHLVNPTYVSSDGVIVHRDLGGCADKGYFPLKPSPPSSPPPPPPSPPPPPPPSPSLSPPGCPEHCLNEASALGAAMHMVFGQGRHDDCPSECRGFVPTRPTSPLAETDPETSPSSETTSSAPMSSSPCTATDAGRSEPCGPGAVPNSADRPDEVATRMAERGSRVPSPWPLHPNGRAGIPAVPAGSPPRRSQSASSSTRVLQAQELEAA